MSRNGEPGPKTAEGRRPGIDPCPAEIRRRAAAIRAEWSAETELSRRCPAFRTREWRPPVLRDAGDVDREEPFRFALAPEHL